MHAVTAENSNHKGTKVTKNLARFFVFFVAFVALILVLHRRLDAAIVASAAVTVRDCSGVLRFPFSVFRFPFRTDLPLLER